MIVRDSKYFKASDCSFRITEFCYNINLTELLWNFIAKHF